MTQMHEHDGMDWESVSSTVWSAVSALGDYETMYNSMRSRKIQK